MKRPNEMSCQDVFRRLDDFVDRELDAAERRLVEEHLESCAECASEYDFEATLIDELRAKVSRLQVPERLRARIAARLEEDEQEGGSN